MLRNLNPAQIWRTIALTLMVALLTASLLAPSVAGQNGKAPASTDEIRELLDAHHGETILANEALREEVALLREQVAMMAEAMVGVEDRLRAHEGLLQDLVERTTDGDTAADRLDVEVLVWTQDWDISQVAMLYVRVSHGGEPVENLDLEKFVVHSVNRRPACGIEARNVESETMPGIYTARLWAIEPCGWVKGSIIVMSLEVTDGHRHGGALFTFTPGESPQASGAS